MLLKLKPGVDFIKVQRRTAFTLVDPKSAKKYS
jgi:hypothetical protein